MQKPMFMPKNNDNKTLTNKYEVRPWGKKYDDPP
jgi:hypothetical protein